MRFSILVAMKDSKSSGAIIRYLSESPFHRDDLAVTLLHVLKQPTASEALLGEFFAEKTTRRVEQFLEDAKNQLVEAGFREDRITAKISARPYPTISEGVIEAFGKGEYQLVVIGRRKKSKSEEFVLGDISVKLVRELSRNAVLVVKSE